MMGGDGGLTNCLRALLATGKINLDLLKFVTLPFGSGNDAGRVFGWGISPEAKHLQSL